MSQLCPLESERGYTPKLRTAKTVPWSGRDGVVKLFRIKRNFPPEAARVRNETQQDVRNLPCWVKESYTPNPTGCEEPTLLG